MKFIQGVICCSVLFSTLVNAEIVSEYTSLKDEDCKNLSTDDYFYEAICPAKGGYTLKVIGADLRYGADLIYKNTKVSYQPMVPFNVGDTAEWRYREVGNQKDYFALIYRVYVAQIDTAASTESYIQFLPELEDQQELVVVGLNKEKSCLMGVIKQSRNMNQKARALAESKSAQCTK